MAYPVAVPGWEEYASPAAGHSGPCQLQREPIYKRQDRGLARALPYFRRSSISLISDPPVFALLLRCGGLGLRGHSFVAPSARQAMCSRADYELVRRKFMRGKKLP